MAPEDVNFVHRLYDNRLPSTLEDCNPLRRRILKEITAAIVEEYEFDDESTVLMDFACGTGLVSQQLAPYCKEIVGVDHDPYVVAHYNRTITNQGISRDEMRAVCGDENNIGLEAKLFDVIVCAQAYHHFEDIRKVTIALAAHLRSGGTLIIVDHLRMDSDSSAAIYVHEETEHTVAHPGGFREADIAAALTGAALESVSIRSFTEFKKRGQVCEMFIASGERTSAGP